MCPTSTTTAGGSSTRASASSAQIAVVAASISADVASHSPAALRAMSPPRMYGENAATARSSTKKRSSTSNTTGSLTSTGRSPGSTGSGAMDAPSA
jgi:hypothetical protein